MEPTEYHAFEVETSDCPTDSVTVFSDRAEVTRLVNVGESKVGQQEVRINGLPTGIRPDSIHVAGGKGAATVLEVSYEVVYNDIVKAGEKERIQDELEVIAEKLSSLEKSRTRNQQERDLLSKYTDKIFEIPSSVPHKAEESTPSFSDLVSGDNLNGISNYLQFVRDNSLRLDNQSNELNKREKELDEESSKLKERLRLVKKPGQKKETRRVTIVFLTQKQTKVQFGLVYIVGNASWNPSYDVRISSEETDPEDKSEKKEGPKLALTYYGRIQQNTGEDWSNAKVSLSTASPASAAHAPTPETRTLRYEVLMPYGSSELSGGGGRGGMVRSKSKKEEKSKKKQKSSRKKDISYDDDYEEESEEDDEPMEIQTASTKKNAISATFEIPRRTTIASDNKPHKVTITILDLEPKMEYFTIPRVNDNAYLRAVSENKSEVSLLPGPASIFLDNDFIATSDLSTVSSGVQYQFLLGVDSGIRIKHEAVKTVSSQSGLIKKSKDINVEHKTNITNTKKVPVDIFVMDSLPISKEETLKVKMEEPDLKKVNNVQFDEHTGKITWKLQIAPGATVVLPFKFKVDHPSDKSIVGLDEADAK